MDAKAQVKSEVDEVRLGDLMQIAWRGKWLIVCGTLGFGIAGAALTMIIPKKYAATIIVDPVSNSPGLGQMGGGLGAIASEFGGLASLAGLRLPQESSKSAETLAVLESEALTERYIAANNLLPILYAKRWNAAKRQWKVSDEHAIPTLWKANRYFKSKIREVSVDPKTGLVTMIITWTNPELAAQWANGLVKMTNDYLRQKAINQSERNIAYLTQQAAKTDVVGVKQVIYDLMQSEISKAMMARGNEEYALRVIDPAQAPEEPSSPKPILWTIASLFVGGFLSFLVALLKAEAPGRRPAPRPAINAT
jgi:uncharacterized protein involved in exopolysaccharide biosynthesis